MRETRAAAPLAWLLVPKRGRQALLTEIASEYLRLLDVKLNRIRASVTPYAQQYVRLGTSLHVDEDDVDAAVSSVKALQG